MRPSTLLRPAAALSVIFSAWTVSAQPTEMDIAAAIQRGMQRKTGFSAVNASGSGLPFTSSEYTPFIVLVSGPLNRIEDLAAKAAKEYRTFTRADVTPDMLADEIEMLASPKRPDSVRDTVLRAERIVIQAKAKAPVTIQPTRSVPFPVEWANGFGAKVSSQGMNSSFASADVPEGELVIVIVTQGREARLPLKAAQRARIH